MPIFLADLHLKSRTWTNDASVRGDAYAVLKKISSRVLAKTIIIGGDFFDSNRPTSEDLLHTAEFLDGFTRIYYVRGNHDSCEPYWFEVLSRLDHSDDMEITELHGQIETLTQGVYLTGVSWMPSRDQLKKTIYDTLQYYCDNYPQNSRLYCVLHTSFKHLLAFDGAYTLDADELYEKFGQRNITILVGDIHTRNTKVYRMSDGKPGLIIHSPGACYPQSTAEITEAHCITGLYYNGSTEKGFEDIDVTVRNYIRVIWEDQAALDKKLAELNADKEMLAQYPLPPLVWVVVSDIEKMPRVNPSDYPNLLIQIRVELQDNADAAKVAGADPADGYTMQQALEEEFNDPDMAAMALQLINSPSPLEELQKYTEFWNVKKAID